MYPCNIATDAHYEAYSDASGVMFPQQILIWRPQEEYSITLSVVKMRWNEPLKDEQFALVQPPESELVNLDQSKKEGSATPAQPSTPQDGGRSKDAGESPSSKPTS